MENESDLLTVNEVAAALGVSRNRVDYLVLARRLVPVRERPRMFRRADVESFKFLSKRPAKSTPQE